MDEQIIKKTKRAGDVDLLRAFAIIIMIMGHIKFGQIFDKWIHAFHMPLWFIISGYFMNTSKDTKQFLIKKAKTLLVPYLVFSLLYEIIYFIHGFNRFKGIIYPNSIQVPYNGAVWFLPALFISEVICFLLIKYLPNWVAYVLIAIMSLLGCFYLIALPFAADSALVGTGFILGGYLMRRYFDKILDIPWWVGVGIFLLFSTLALINGDINMRANVYANIALFWVNAFAITCSLWVIFKGIDRMISFGLLKEIGEQSLIYVCTNQFIIFIIHKVLTTENMGMMELLLEKLFELTIIVCLCFWGSRLIRKTKLKFILGR